MASRRPAAGTWALLALSPFLAHVPARAADKQPTVFEVLLPADAELEVEGVKTRSAGASRRFQSPPVEAGSTYAYTLKATWRGRTVTRTVHIRPDLVTQVDLRAELEAAAPAPQPPDKGNHQAPEKQPAVGSFALQAPEAVAVAAGGRVPLTLHIKRDRFTKPLAVSFAGLPSHVKVVPAGGTIGAAETAWRGFVEASPEATAGDTSVRVSASAGGLQQDATIRLTVSRPAPPPASFRVVPPGALTVRPGGAASFTVTIRRQNFDGPVALSFRDLPAGIRIPAGGIAAGADEGRFTATADKEARPGPAKVTVLASGGGRTDEAVLRLTVETPPPPPAALALDVPPTLQVQAGAKAVLRVGVRRDHFTGPVAVHFDGLPRGVTLENLTVAADRTSADVPLRASADAGPKTVEIGITAAGGGVKTGVRVRLTITATAPEPGLALELPEGVEVEPGRTRLVEVRVLPKGAAALAAEPAVTVTPPADGKVKLTPWSASDFKAGAGSYVRGYAVRAAADAPPGEAEFRVRAVIDGRSAVGTFKVAVRKPLAPPPPPAAELQLVLPEGVEIEPGRTRLIEVRVLPKDAAALTAEPAVTVTPPADGKIKLTPWSASDFKADAGSYARGYTLRAAADAPPGEAEVRVRAVAAGRSVERSFKVTVRRPGS